MIHTGSGLNKIKEDYYGNKWKSIKKLVFI